MPSYGNENDVPARIKTNFQDETDEGAQMGHVGEGGAEKKGEAGEGKLGGKIEESGGILRRSWGGHEAGALDYKSCSSLEQVAAMEAPSPLPYLHIHLTWRDGERLRSCTSPGDRLPSHIGRRRLCTFVSP